MYWDSFDCQEQCEELFEEMYEEDLIEEEDAAVTEQAYRGGLLTFRRRYAL